MDTSEMLEFALGYGLCVVGVVAGAYAGLWGPIYLATLRNPLAANDGIGAAAALFVYAPVGAVLGGVCGHLIGVSLAAKWNNRKR